MRLCVLSLSLLVAWRYLARDVFRFRMTMEIEADGKLHTASSIIEVFYYGGGGVAERRWHTSHKGVTPMVDLGPHGTVMAVFDYDAVAYRKRLAKLGIPVGPMGQGMPKSIDDVSIAAYNLPPEKLFWRLPKTEVPRNFLPSLVWLPRDAHWREADIILPEEMPARIDASVRFVRMAIEPAPWAWLVTQIDPAPEWLRKMRHDHRKQYILPSEGCAFHPLKIESEYSR